MKTIIVDLPDDLTSKTSVLLSFKVYMHKNSQYSLLVFGRSSDLPVLEGIESIKTVEVEENLSTTESALSELNKGSYAGLLSFAKRKDLLAAATKTFEKSLNPCFGLSYKDKKDGKETFLIEASGYFKKNAENLRAYLDYGNDYLINVVGKDEPTIGLLSLEGADDPVLSSFDEEMRPNKKYRGPISPDAMFDGEADLLLSSGADGAISILASKGARKIIKESDEAASNRSSSAKWGSMFGIGKGQKEKEKEIYDSRIDMKGYVLFGFGYNIISLNKDSGYGDFFDGIEKLEQVDRKKPFHK